MTMERLFGNNLGNRKAVRSPSGEFEVSRLDAFELLEHFQIIVWLLAAASGIHTVQRGFLDQLLAPLKSMEKMTTFIFIHSLCSACLHFDLLMHPR